MAMVIFIWHLQPKANLAWKCSVCKHDQNSLLAPGPSVLDVTFSIYKDWGFLHHSRELHRFLWNQSMMTILMPKMTASTLLILDKYWLVATTSPFLHWRRFKATWINKWVLMNILILTHLQNNNMSSIYSHYAFPSVDSLRWHCVTLR